MITDYDDEMHQRCMMWATWLCDPKRSLLHRACLARFIAEHAQELCQQVQVLMQIKLNIQLANRAVKQR